MNFLRLHRGGLLFLVLAAVLGAGGLRASSASAATWQRLADLPQGQAFPGQTPQQIGERLFLLAGANYRVHALLVQDLPSGTWTMQPTALLTSRHHYATAALGGRLYVAGGCMGESDAIPHRRTNAVESYDPETKLWTPLAPMLTARQAFQLVPFGGRLYAIGGTDREEAPITTIEIYDPATNSWREQPAPWPQSLAWCQAVVHGDRIAVHGRTPDGVVFLLYDPAGNTATHLSPGMSAEMRNHGVALVGDTLLLIGGGTKQPEARVLCYDFNRDAWSEFAPLPEPRAHAGVTAVGQRVLCLGGAGPTWDWAHPATSVFALDLSFPK